jgi:hypothetical protein
MMSAIFFALAIVFAPAAASAGCGCHAHRHWYYQGYHRGDIYHYGPPENGGYRSGYYGGRYHDNTTYKD